MSRSATISQPCIQTHLISLSNINFGSLSFADHSLLSVNLAFSLALLSGWPPSRTSIPLIGLALSAYWNLFFLLSFSPYSSKALAPSLSHILAHSSSNVLSGHPASLLHTPKKGFLDHFVSGFGFVLKDIIRNLTIWCANICYSSSQ